MWKKKFVYVLNYLKTFKAMHKNNPRTQSPQQNNKAVLKTAAYLKVYTIGRKGNNCSSFTFFVYQKVCFRSKTEKMNTTIDFCIFELVLVPNFSLQWQFWFIFNQICSKSVFPLENEKIAIVRASMVFTYFNKLFRLGCRQTKRSFKKALKNNYLIR